MAGGALRLGVIGTGGFAAHHLKLLSQSGPDVVVVAHLGRRMERAEAAAAQFGGTAFADLGAFVAKGKPDAVIISVTPDAHGVTEMVLAESGIPFLVEKPAGLDAETVEGIAEAVAQAGLPAAVGFNWRASDCLDELRALLDRHPPRMVMGRWHGGTPGVEWWRRQARSGGQFVEQAIHVVDIALDILGDAELLSAAGDAAPHPDYADADISGAGAALVRFDKGMPGVFTATCLLPDTGGADLRIVCDRAEIVLNQNGFTLHNGGDTVDRRNAADAYVRQDRAFFAAVRSGDTSQLFCPYSDALETHRLVFAIRDAIAAG